MPRFVGKRTVPWWWDAAALVVLIVVIVVVLELAGVIDLFG